MGLKENGDGDEVSSSTLDFGRKNKYRRIDSVLVDDVDDDLVNAQFGDGEICSCLCFLCFSQFRLAWICGGIASDANGGTTPCRDWYRLRKISPAVSRGSLTSFPEILINLDILLGYVSNYTFSGLPAHISRRIMLGVGVIPSVFTGFTLFIIPESPRWLVMRCGIDKARAVREDD
ncbi:hypothetical protein Droror1_Dr00015887 [Drosera rotundifolia]